MHSAIFYAKPDQRAGWDDFLRKIDQKLETNRSFVRLAENVWLLDVKQSAAALGWLIGFSETAGVAYGILPFAQAPEWLPASFDPKPS